MKTRELIETRASELLATAQGFQAATEERGCHVGAPDALGSLEETLQVLSAAWYQLAADASPGLMDPRLSREQEVRLMRTLHDVAAGFARCARTCREGRSAITPILARRAAAGRADDRHHGDGFPRFQRHERPGQRVA
jgi:hypothetical protein